MVKAQTDRNAMQCIPRKQREERTCYVCREECCQLPPPTPISTVHRCSTKSFCSFPYMPPPPLLLHQPQCQQQQQPSKEKYLLLVQNPDKAEHRKNITHIIIRTAADNKLRFIYWLAYIAMPRSWAGDIPFLIFWVLLHLMDSTANISSFLSELWCNSNLRRKHSFLYKGAN